MRYGNNSGGGSGGEQPDNRGRIRLWVNNRATHDKAPQLTGRYTDQDGREWFVSLWESDGRNNGPILTGTVQPPQQNDRPRGGGGYRQQQDGHSSPRPQQQQRYGSRRAPMQNDRPAPREDDYGQLNEDEIPF